MGILAAWRARIAAFCASRRGNVAMIFALSLIPLVAAVGGGIDLARGLVVRDNMSDALDAAALAVGSATTKPTGDCSATEDATACASLQQIAQNYFSANYREDASYGTPGPVQLSYTDKSVTLSVSTDVPVTLLSVIGLTTIPISTSTTVVWGQSKLWVSLVLDNSQSMDQSGKMTALKSAAQQLLTTLQSASTTPGNVQAAIIPFTNDVRVSASSGASWIDWTNWSAQGSAQVPGSNVGPGSSCPYSFGCRKPGTMSRTSSIPSSGSTAGYICPWSDQSVSRNDGTRAHYFMGCFTSAAITKQVSSCRGYSDCSCSGNGSSKTCTATSGWSHAWVPETDHSLWQGCLTDRTQDYDIENVQPSGASGFEADNSDYCPAASATVTPLGYDWSSLSSQINSMEPAGTTNQAIGVAHGWQMLTPGDPYGTPAVPDNTARYIILLSDGLNTEDRWYGNGSDEGTAADDNIDSREEKTCDAAKADGVIIYTIFVNTDHQPNSVPLSYCASDSSKYYVLTSSSQIVTAFNDIAAQITNLRVAK